VVKSRGGKRLIDSGARRGSTCRRTTVWAWLSRWAFGSAILATAIAAAPAPEAGAAVPAGGRAWELVSFAAPTSARTFAVRPMSGDSDEFAYSTLGPSPGSEAGPLATFLTTQRGATGWVNTPISFPYPTLEMEEVLVELMPIFPADFSEDLKTVAWLSTAPLTPEAPSEPSLGLYRKVQGGTPEFIATIEGPTITFFHQGFVEIADDGSSIVFVSARHLLPGDASRTIGESAYGWDGGDLQLLDVDGGGNLLSTCGVRISKENGTSASANLVFLSVPKCEGATEKVFLRDLEDETTTEISASQCTRLDCNSPADVTFGAATRDGSFAFLTTGQQLVDADHDAGTDLYRYDTGTGELALLSGGSAEAGGGVLPNRIYPSEDGGRVYFVGTGEVLPGEAESGEKVFLSDSGGPHLVAEATFPPKPEFQLSADGTRAVFVTQSQLLPGDTNSQTDVYLYDAGDDALTTISGGDGPNRAAIFSGVENFEFQSRGNSEPFYAIDAAGERVFFSTAEALVPTDVNAKVDVYEWWEGELGLISSGADGFDSGFAGVSRDGRSLLFVTNAALTSADVDGGNRDFYVARVGGGFPEPEPEGPQGCHVSLCPAPDREPLVRPTPGSMSSAPKSSRIRVIRIQSAQPGVIGRKTTIVVATPSAGRLSASVWIRSRGKKVVLATGRANAARLGEVRIGLRLTRAGRKPSAAAIRKGHLTVENRDSSSSQIVKLDLG
jgi:hypothetical protein